ncbi:MAG: molybdopterin-dependent oxidoreductase [Gemmatimonadales bacterium]
MYFSSRDTILFLRERGQDMPRLANPSQFPSEDVYKMTTRAFRRMMAIASLAMPGSVVLVAPGTAQRPAVPLATTASIQISGDVPHPLSLSDSGLRSMPRRTIRAAEHGQPEASYEGVALSDVLARAGVTFGSALHGPALATYVMCSAPDGYRVVFTLAELDSAFSDRPVFVVDRKDGQPLDAHTGPFRIVVPGDARPARWIRQLTEIAVVRPPDRQPGSR